MRMHPTRYRDRLKALLVDAQSKDEYFGGYWIRARKAVYSLSIDEATGDKKRDHHCSSQKNRDDDLIEVFVQSLNYPHNIS